MRWGGKHPALGRDTGSQLSGAAGLRSGSCLNILGQSSVAVINLSITSYHPGCQTPSHLSAGPHGSRGKRKQERGGCLLASFAPHPWQESRLLWCQGLGSFPAGYTQEPDVRSFQPGASRQLGRLPDNECSECFMPGFLTAATHTGHRGQCPCASYSLVVPPSPFISLAVAK